MANVIIYILAALGAVIIAVGWAGGVHYFLDQSVNAWIERKDEKRYLEREIAVLSERITELEERGGCHCAQHGADADGDLGSLPEYDLGEQSEADAR